MEHPNIPLQRSLAMSLGVHILIFGTALAFAHYGELLLGGGPRVITVDLVGEGGHQSGGARPSQRSEAEVLPAAPHVPDADALMQEAADSVHPSDAAGNDGGPAGAGPSTGESPGTVVGDGPGGPAGGAGSLSSEEWRMLWSAIEKAKNYPRLARERGIEGVVLLRFRVLPSGTVDEVNIVKSSGAAILDEASVKTLHHAGPMPHVNGWIEVPMVYQLQ